MEKKKRKYIGTFLHMFHKDKYKSGWQIQIRIHEHLRTIITTMRKKYVVFVVNQNIFWYRISIRIAFSPFIFVDTTSLINICMHVMVCYFDRSIVVLFFSFRIQQKNRKKEHEKNFLFHVYLVLFSCIVSFVSLFLLSFIGSGYFSTTVYL